MTALETVALETVGLETTATVGVDVRPAPAAVESCDGSGPTVAGGSDGWTEICALERLTPDRGVAALVDGQQVAVFLLAAGRLCAVDNVDPCSGAAVLSRGIVGDANGVATVASPLYKQRFDLTTGRCLDADVPALTVHEARVGDGIVLVRLRRG
jgi:nitrite reductase (NADH) small subunit